MPATHPADTESAKPRRSSSQASNGQNGVEEAGKQAHDANGEEVVHLIIEEQEREHGKQCHAA